MKYPQKFGEQEILTEFFINRLGRELGFDMAHSGLVRADGRLAFVSRIFTSENETLRHGSLIIEDFYKEERALDRVCRREEQAFYSVDFVASHIRAYCGADFDAILPKFIEMLVFDAIIGSMDRHVQNWGVLAQIKEPSRYRFAPIFDSARALFWSIKDEHLSQFLRDPRELDAYINRARPCLGPVRQHPRVNRCNHFEFVVCLLTLYPYQTRQAIENVSDDTAEIGWRLLHRFPFDGAFSNQRKQLISRVLMVRTKRIKSILEEDSYATR